MRRDWYWRRLPTRVRVRVRVKVRGRVQVKVRSNYWYETKKIIGIIPRKLLALYREKYRYYTEKIIGNLVCIELRAWVCS